MVRGLIWALSRVSEYAPWEILAITNDSDLTFIRKSVDGEVALSDIRRKYIDCITQGLEHIRSGQDHEVIV